MKFELADRINIHELLGTHGHLIDAGRLEDESLETVFVPDVRYDVTALGGGVLIGISSIREAGLALGSDNPVAHIVTNIVVTPDADGMSASALSKGLGILTDGTAGSVSYNDRLVRTVQGWRIVERVVTPRREPLTP